MLGHAALLSACICVLLDWDAPRQSLVKGLRALDIPIQVLLVGIAEAAPPGPMADRPGDLQQLDADRIAEGLAAL